MSPFNGSLVGSNLEWAMLGTVLLILLILVLVGVTPLWPYSREWGYAPSGVIGVVLVIVLVLALTGRF
jgi:hypothetical protein